LIESNYIKLAYLAIYKTNALNVSLSAVGNMEAGWY